MTYRGHIKNGVAILDTPADLPDGTAVRIEIEPDNGDFWRGKSVAELAQEQNVCPPRSLDDLAGDWPKEDSVDEFFDLVGKIRQ